MAVRRTRTGDQLQWYDADGRFQKGTFRGITREEAIRIERDLLARRDRGEPEMDRRLVRRSVPSPGPGSRSMPQRGSPPPESSTRMRSVDGLSRPSARCACAI